MSSVDISITSAASQHQLQEIKESQKQIRHVTDNIHLSGTSLTTHIKYTCVTHMYDLFHVCLDNSEEVYRIAIPEKSELEELAHSGELQMTNNNNDIILMCNYN